MMTFFIALTFAAALATSAVAKTDKVRPAAQPAASAGIASTSNSVTCGHLVLTDPDPAIRGSFARECAHHERPHD